MQCELTAWTEFLSKAVYPLVALMIFGPLGLGAVRAYSRYLQTLATLERSSGRRLNGSGE